MPVVLLVDDNKLNQLVAKGTLKRLNYAVDIVDSGADAVRACAARGYDAVLMDIMMPGMDGLEATARIRAVDETQGRDRHTPIIGLSARAMEGDREQALAAGLDEYLTKPVREDELKAALERWIRPVVVE